MDQARRGWPLTPPAGINAATRELGIERKEGQRATKIASITPEAKDAVRAAGLDDKQTILLKAAVVHDIAAARLANRNLCS